MPLDPKKRRPLTRPRERAQLPLTDKPPRGGQGLVVGVPRVGHGYDIHKLQPGGQLVLAGVVVSQEISPVAHSDGDVVIHAIVDALLGAMGWGDIGEMFSDTDPRWKGAAGRLFIEEVYPKVRAAGYRLSNLDVTVLAERPRLAPFKAQMIASLAGMFGLGGTINLKAATNEGCDAVGRGEAVAAHAVVLLAKAQD